VAVDRDGDTARCSAGAAQQRQATRPVATSLATRMSSAGPWRAVRTSISSQLFLCKYYSRSFSPPIQLLRYQGSGHLWALKCGPQPDAPAAAMLFSAAD